MKNLFSPAQRNYLLFRKLKVGSIYMLPRYGFSAYSAPSSDGVYIDTNPFTASLDYQPVELIEIADDFANVKFINSRKGKRPQFWVKSFDLEYRGVAESLFLSALMIIPFCIYNIAYACKNKIFGEAK